MTPARKRGSSASGPVIGSSSGLEAIIGRRACADRSAMFAELPMRSCVLSGNVSRSSPAVVMFSPVRRRRSPTFALHRTVQVSIMGACRRFSRCRLSARQISIQARIGHHRHHLRAPCPASKWWRRPRSADRCLALSAQGDDRSRQLWCGHLQRSTRSLRVEQRQIPTATPTLTPIWLPARRRRWGCYLLPLPETLLAKAARLRRGDPDLFILSPLEHCLFLAGCRARILHASS